MFGGVTSFFDGFEVKFGQLCLSDYTNSASTRKHIGFLDGCVLQQDSAFFFCWHFGIQTRTLLYLL